MYGLIRGTAQPRGYGTHILQIYWIYKDAIIDLNSRIGRSVSDKLFFK